MREIISDETYLKKFGCN